MGKTKTQMEAKDKPEPMQKDDKHATPDKKGGPQATEVEHAQEQAAGALDDMHPDATPIERARKVKKMQRKVGNRRLAKMLDETQVEPHHAHDSPP